MKKLPKALEATSAQEGIVFAERGAERAKLEREVQAEIETDHRGHKGLRTNLGGNDWRREPDL